MSQGANRKGSDRNKLRTNGSKVTGGRRLTGKGALERAHRRLHHGWVVTDSSDASEGSDSCHFPMVRVKLFLDRSLELFFRRLVCALRFVVCVRVANRPDAIESLIRGRRHLPVGIASRHRGCIAAGRPFGWVIISGLITVASPRQTPRSPGAEIGGFFVIWSCGRACVHCRLPYREP